MSVKCTRECSDERFGFFQAQRGPPCMYVCIHVNVCVPPTHTLLSIEQELLQVLQFWKRKQRWDWLRFARDTLPGSCNYKLVENANSWCPPEFAWISGTERSSLERCSAAPKLMTARFRQFSIPVSSHVCLKCLMLNYVLQWKCLHLENRSGRKLVLGMILQVDCLRHFVASTWSITLR